MNQVFHSEGEYRDSVADYVREVEVVCWADIRKHVMRTFSINAEDEVELESGGTRWHTIVSNLAAHGSLVGHHTDLVQVSSGFATRAAAHARGLAIIDDGLWPASKRSTEAKAKNKAKAKRTEDAEKAQQAELDANYKVNLKHIAQARYFDDELISLIKLKKMHGADFIKEQMSKMDWNTFGALYGYI